MSLIEEEEMTVALVKELCSGRMLLDQRQPFREIEAAKEAYQMRGHKTSESLGKLVISVPQREYFQIRQKYGDECWHDRGFIKDFQRLEPTMASNKA